MPASMQDPLSLLIRSAESQQEGGKTTGGLGVGLGPGGHDQKPPLPHRYLYAGLLLLVTPAITLLLCIFLYQELMEYPISPLEGWQRFLQVIAEGLLDHYLYGSIVFPFVAIFVYPCWLLFWNVLFWK